jgi:dCTP deaminase
VILSDREIAAALENGLIRIDPQPPANLWTSTALDLTLDGVLLEWTARPSASGELPRLRPHGPNFDIWALLQDTAHASRLAIDPGEGYPLLPGSFVLGYTQQALQLPHRSRIAARVEGKSSLARLGVGVHVTAPTIHAGFGFDTEHPDRPGKPIQLEIFNVGKWAVVLDVGMPICQLILEEVREVPRKGYQGRFSQQTAFTTEVPSPPTLPS